MAGNLQCVTIKPLLGEYIDDVLDAATQLQVAQHVASCTACYAELHELLSIDVDSLLRTMSPIPVPVTQRQHLFAALNAQEPVTPSAAPRPITHPHISAVATSRSTGRITRILQVASILVIIAIIAGVITTLKIQASSTIGFTTCPTIPGDKQWHIVTRHQQQLLNDRQQLTCDPHITVGHLWQVSPDGRWVAYVNNVNNSVHIVSSTATSDHAVITTGGAIAAIVWSPASTTLAIVKHYNGQFSLWVAGLHGVATQTSAAITAQTIAAAPMWSRDSAAIAWSVLPDAATETVLTANLQTRTFTSFVVAGRVGVAQWVGGMRYQLAWSMVQGNDIVALNLWQSATKSTTTPISSSAVAISPTSGMLAYARHDGVIVTRDSDTGNETPLAQLGAVAQLYWSPDGTQLIAVSNQSLWLVTSQKLIRLGGYDARSLFAWSADSTAIAYLADGQLQLINTAGTTPITPVADSGDIQSLSWSPDNTQLLIGGSHHNVIVHLASGNRATLLSSTSDEQPQWSVTR